MAAAGGVLYVIGGMLPEPATELGDPTPSVEAFAPRLGRWEARAPMALPRGFAGAATVRGRIVVAGGLVRPGADGGTLAQSTDAVEVYDPARDVWEPGPPLPALGAHVQMVEVGGRLYAFAGRGQRTFIGVLREPPAAAAAAPARPFPVARVVAVGLAGAALASWWLGRRARKEQG
jgi:hypothetical protein